MVWQLWANLVALPLLLIAALLWRGDSALARRAAAIGRRVAQRPAVAVALCFVAGLGSSALPTLVFGPPVPQAHDEFCYLLQADTFARGRLTNPPPPLAEHFENPHQLLHPTYTGKYHPGQGLVLAAGLSIGGSAVVGLWLQVGLFGAALGWMLRQWLPATWALGTAMMALAWLGSASYWGYSFWGGAVPAAAGALLFGAAWRMSRRPAGRARWSDGAWLGLGLVGLALTRPFDGLLAAIATGVWLLPKAAAAGRRWWRAAAACALVLAAGAGWLLAYDRAVTGDAWLMPYVLYERTSAAAPFFVWQEERDPAPRALGAGHPELEIFHRLYYAQWRSQRTLRGWLRSAAANLRRSESFFLGPVLWLPLLVLRWRDERVRFAAATTAWVLAGALTLAFFLPHYIAPVTSLVIVLAALGVRRLRRWRWRGRASGARLAAGVVVAACGVMAGNFAALGESRQEGWGRQRSELAARLEASPGRDLVLVGFGGETIDNGWVYNGADLESSPLVWARSMGPEADCELAARFPDRRLWRIEIRDLAVAPRPVEMARAACAAATRG